MNQMETISLFAAVAAACAAATVDEVRPNVVFIITDDQMLNTVSAYGGMYQTPHINRLAEEGMRFDRAYTTAALCVPTRYTCLTGSWASRNQWRSPNDRMRRVMNNAYLDIGHPTIAGALKKAGYRTGFVGKDHSVEELDMPLIDLPKDADPNDPSVKEALQINNDRLTGFIQSWGFEYVGGLVHGNLDRQYPDRLAVHNMEYILQGGLDFLDQQTGRQPFFLWFATTLTHTAELALEEDDPHLTPLGVQETVPEVMKPRQQMAKELGNGHTSGMEAKVKVLDEAVGVLLDRLDRMGVAENTLVIFMSDQDNRGKSTVYENGINTLFIARWPKVIPPGSVCDELVENSDLVPTWLDVAGADPLPAMTLDGYSLMPLFRGSRAPLREAVFSEMGFAKSVTTKEWKYIAIRYDETMVPDRFVPPQSGTVAEHIQKGTFDGFTVDRGPFGQSRWIGTVDPDQLYDLRRDPQENNNLAGNPEYRQQLEKMKSLLSQKIQQTGRPFGEFKE